MSGIAPISATFRSPRRRPQVRSAGSQQVAGSGRAEMLSGAMACKSRAICKPPAAQQASTPWRRSPWRCCCSAAQFIARETRPFQMLAMMAMMGGMQSGGVSASFSFNVSGVDQAYAGGTVAAGPNVGPGLKPADGEPKRHAAGNSICDT